MGLRKNMTEALELPKEIMLGLPLISLLGREEVTIENYKGILEYDEESVRIGGGRYTAAQRQGALPETADRGMSCCYRGVRWIGISDIRQKKDRREEMASIPCFCGKTPISFILFVFYMR